MLTVNSLSFGNCEKALSIGTNFGFKTFTFASHRPNVEHASQDIWEVILFEREISSKRGFYVCQNNTRLVLICGLEGTTRIHKLEFSARVSAIRVNSKILAVRVGTKIHVYSAKRLTLLCVFPVDPESAPEALAICSWWIAFGDSKFRVDMRRVGKTENTLTPCFEESIGIVRFSRGGEYLAVASVTGVLIKVFEVGTASRKFQFVRGLTRSVKITSLAFCGLDYLVASSDTDSVHLFHLSNVVEPSPVWLTITKTALSYLPIQMAKMVSYVHSVATIRLPCGGGRATRTMIFRHKGELVLYVFSALGWFYCFLVDDSHAVRQIVEHSLT